MKEGLRSSDAVRQQLESEAANVVLGDLVAAGYGFGAGFAVESRCEAFAQCAHAAARPHLPLEDRDVMTLSAKFERGTKSRQSAAEHDHSLCRAAPFQSIQLGQCRSG